MIVRYKNYIVCPIFAALTSTSLNLFLQRNAKFFQDSRLSESFSSISYAPRYIWISKGVLAEK